MDTFMSKLSQKINAQEMIRANTAADTAKMEAMRRQMEAYDRLLQDMRKVNLKAAENMDLMQSTIKEGLRKIEEIQGNNDAQADNERLLTETKKQMEEFLPKLQRQTDELLPKMQMQMEGLLPEIRKQVEESLEEMRKQMEEGFAKADDFLHKENVKVYRNVQASVVEELNKQNEVLVEKMKERIGEQKSMMPVSIIIILLILGDIAIHLLDLLVI
ncbi:MAG: hypothetical protein J1F41_09005 [Lachnospiraceae bacterium]|nr:hypothetical protein [Lachnospiraceae bacterium]